MTLMFISGFLLYRISTPSPLANRIQNIEEKLEIVNLGTSHGNDFDYTDCALNGQNINREGNTLYYDLQNYIFLNEKNYLSKDAVVLIPVSYFVFGCDENRTDRLSDDSFVNDFYYYLPKEQIYSYSKEKNVSIIVQNIQRNIHSLFEESKNVKNTKYTTDSTIRKNAFSRANYHKKLSHYSSNQKNYNYLDSLIKEVIKNKHIPILVSTPYHYSYNDNFGREWLNNNYFKIMNSISAKYDIPYLDYSHDSRFCFTIDYFANSDHLNSVGKKKFSSVVFYDVQKITPTPPPSSKPTS